MKVVLVSPYPDITNYGLRTLSAVIREAGHSTRLLCMPDFTGDGVVTHGSLGAQRYPPSAIRGFLELVEDADLIGISVMTHYFDTARQLTEAVRRRHGRDKPVIWGGFHPSARPVECLHHADFVAVGDAEELVLALVQRLDSGELEDLSDIPSLAWRRGEVAVCNPTACLVQDLDAWPPPDFSGQDHWVLHQGELCPLDSDMLHRYLRNGSISRLFGKVGYQTMTGRGCPHGCAYCGNSFYRDLYRGQRYVRFRSVRHVMNELEEVVARHPFIDLIWFSDDSFFARSLPDIQEFAREYRRRIGLPFYLLGSPGTITEAKYEALVDAGLLCIQMGIESGSPRIQRLFHRSALTNDKVLESARIISRHVGRTLPPQYDLVYDLPYETLEDKLQTLRLVARLPKPYRLQVFSIIYYPGTPLHTLAVQDGLLVDERDQVYDRMYSERHDSYPNTLLFLSRSGRFPRPLLELLASAEVAQALTSDYAAPAGAVAKLALTAFRRLARNPAVERARALGSLSSLPGVRVG